MHEFLRSLFGFKPEEAYVLLWLLDGKKSHWFVDLDEAARFAEAHDQQDLYVGVGLSGEDYGPKRRCRAAEITGIPGLWADIDVAGAAHKKGNLPPTEDDARALVRSMPLPPTLVVWSGHGLQVWWLFKEPWLFDGPAERDQAAQLAAAWNRLLRAKADERGWDTDATWDLSRVMRLPGTMNCKVPDEPAFVALIEQQEDRRYDPSDLQDCLPPAGAPEPSVVPVPLPAVDAEAAPPFAKFEALAEAEPRFLRSWQRKRTDLQDQSPSGYDLSLTSFTVAAGWTNQEITDLLIASRRKHGDDLKRPDYYARTITNARGGRERERAFETLEDLSSPKGETRIPDEVERRGALLAELSRVLGIGIVRIIRYTTDPPEFRLETEHGAIHLGEVRHLINQDALRVCLAAAAGYYMLPVKKTEWGRVAQWLLDVCEEEEVGEDATTEGRARAWIGLYLAAHRPRGDEEKDASSALVAREPYKRDGWIYVFGTSLRKFINVDQMEGLSARQMGMVLKAAGCVPERINLVTGGRHTTASVWRLPREEELDADLDDGGGPLRVVV